MRPSDEEIASRIRRRDRNAFDVFFDAYSSALLGYLGAMGLGSSQAEDLLQETMLRVFRHIDRYTEQMAFRSWVFRIATNLAYTELRRRRLAPIQGLDENILRIPDRSLAPHERLESEDRVRIVELGLARLPSEQRAVLLLRVRQGMEIREIARTLCVPEGTVKSRIHHAVRKLREFARRWECPEIEVEHEMP